MRLFFTYILFLFGIISPVWAVGSSLPSGAGTVNSCSAALIKIANMNESHKAIIATNGHCLLLNLYFGKQMAYPLPEEILSNVTDQDFLNKTSIAAF